MPQGAEEELEARGLINIMNKPLSTACEPRLKKDLSFVLTMDCNEFNTIIDFHKCFDQ